jgi:hypothetical protein
MSFEKREVTRPIGFESKNWILDLRTFQAILVCMFVVAVKTKSEKIRDLAILKRMKAPVAAIKIFQYLVSAYCSSYGNYVQSVRAYEGII